VSNPALWNTVSTRRRAAGLSQRALAEAVGVSRQALVAVESGRSVPSTALALRLARALACAVDDLFGLTGPTALEAVPARGVGVGGRVSLGRVDGVWVAHPLGVGAPRTADGLVERSASPNVEVAPFGDPRELADNALVAGCAPLLGVLAAGLWRGPTNGRATWIPADSGRALALLESGHVHVAGLHLAHGADDGHADMVAARFPDRPVRVIHLTRWRQGLLVLRGNPLGIRQVDDLRRPGLRVALRAPGSGARVLLDRLLGGDGSAQGPLAADHADVAQLVRLGLADTGVAIESVAAAAGLDFIPLSEERFDLVLPEDRCAHVGIARLLDALHSAAFRREARALPGYDVAACGQAVTVGAC